MFLWPLLLALQSQPTVRATASDSALARSTLRAGLAAFDSVSTETEHQLTVNRYLEQLLVWNMKEEGGEVVLRFDRASTRAWKATSVRAAYWLRLLLDSGDTVTSEQFIVTIPPRVREIQMVLAGQLLVTGANFPPFHNNLPRVFWLESRLTNPSHRAELVASRAQVDRNSTAARELFRQAIRLSQADTTEMSNTWKWMIALLKMGDSIPMTDIVRAAAYPAGDVWIARQIVSDELAQQGLSHLARPFTVAARAERISIAATPESRIAIHFLRATPRDTSRAWAIQDSLDAAEVAGMTFTPPPTASEKAAHDAAGARALTQLAAVEAMSRSLLGWRPRFTDR